MSLAFKVQAGPHNRYATPMQVPLPAPDDWPEHAMLQGPGGLCLPADKIGDTLYFVLPALPSSEEAAFELCACQSDGEGVQLSLESERISISYDGKEVTAYNFAGDLVRPYLYPLLGPSGKQVTRNFPMKDLPDESHDHKHHRSVWIAHGDLNGTDNWSEEPNHGWQQHLDFELIFSGGALGRLVEKLQWETNDHKPQLSERRTVTCWNIGGENRLFDFQIELTALDEDVLFGDTKEGGLLSVRVASELDVPRTGTITNSFGGVDEGETWGKRAHWCDYSGTVEGTPLGLAIFDSPANPWYPTWWHVRNYGLMTANPFGLTHFEPETGRRGDLLLKAGETLTARFRLYVHSGDVVQGRVQQAYLDYVAPPKVSFE